MALGHLTRDYMESCLQYKSLSLLFLYTARLQVIKESTVCISAAYKKCKYVPSLLTVPVKDGFRAFRSSSIPSSQLPTFTHTGHDVYVLFQLLRHYCSLSCPNGLGFYDRRRTAGHGRIKMRLGPYFPICSSSPPATRRIWQVRPPYTLCFIRHAEFH